MWQSAKNYLTLDHIYELLNAHKLSENLFLPLLQTMNILDMTGGNEEILSDLSKLLVCLFKKIDSQSSPQGKVLCTQIAVCLQKFNGYKNHFKDDLASMIKALFKSV